MLTPEESGSRGIVCLISYHFDRQREIVKRKHGGEGALGGAHVPERPHCVKPGSPLREQAAAGGPSCLAPAPRCRQPQLARTRAPTLVAPPGLHPHPNAGGPGWLTPAPRCWRLRGPLSRWAEAETPAGLGRGLAFSRSTRPRPASALRVPAAPQAELPAGGRTQLLLLPTSHPHAPPRGRIPCRWWAPGSGPHDSTIPGQACGMGAL